jgi:hypothetical protein
MGTICRFCRHRPSGLLSRLRLDLDTQYPGRWILGRGHARVRDHVRDCGRGHDLPIFSLTFGSNEDSVEKIEIHLPCKNNTLMTFSPKPTQPIIRTSFGFSTSGNYVSPRI